MENLQGMKAPPQDFQMDKALTVLGEYRFWHPHLALCISPHFVRWGEIYPIFGPD